MSVTRLFFKNFRNYADLDVSLGPGSIALYGNNGTGKTNILEALSFFSPGRGLRGSKLSDIITFHASQHPWSVSVTFNQMAGDVLLGTSLEWTPQGNERRAIMINQTPATRQAQLAEWISVIWVTPQMNPLFSDGASQRRKFLDRLVFALDPPHARRLQQYEHWISERSSYLRQGHRDLTWLETIEHQLACQAYEISLARVYAIANVIAHQNSDTPFPQFRGQMEGPFEDLMQSHDREKVILQTQAHLAQNRLYDKERGGCRFGPHRSDFAVIHQGLGISAGFCSTGQQKMLLMAIILAFVRAQHQASLWQRPCLLLIDDVAAHLDAHHRQILFEDVVSMNVQVWLTGTERHLFDSLGEQVQRLRVENARLISDG